MAECEHIASGQFPAPGVPGATFVPGVEEVPEGYEVSWENNRNLPNPDPVRLLHGKSAYQLAVEAGYEGTEVEFAAEMADAAVAKAKAEAAAEAAGKSETNAAAAADAAAQSEQNAKDSEETARQAAGEAEQLAQAAAGSAGAASLSERNAAASEQAAEDAAEEAGNRATAAGNAAGAAARSEANAKTSEENAARSEAEAKKAAQEAQGVILSGPARPGQLLLVESVSEDGKLLKCTAVDPTHGEGMPITVEILPETVVQFEDHQAMLPMMGIVAGETYTVTWDGTDYDCTAESVTVLGMSGIMLGNPAAYGGDDNGVPFAIGDAPSQGLGMCASITGAEQATVRVVQTRSVIHKLDPKFLPEGVPYTETVLAAPTFDGNLEGREILEMFDGFYIVKVSDQILYTEDLVGATAVGVMGGTAAPVAITEDMIQLGDGTGAATMVIYEELPMVVSVNALTEEDQVGGLSLGTWFGCVPGEVHVESLSCLNPVEGKTYHKLDNNLLDLDWLPVRVPKTVEMLAETTVSGAGAETINFEIASLAVGDVVHVTVNGTTYNCTVTSIPVGDGVSYKIVGNLHLLDNSMANTGEPFVILPYVANELQANITCELTDYTLSISAVKYGYNQIPEGYLPTGSVYTMPTDLGESVVMTEAEKAASILNSGGTVKALKDGYPGHVLYAGGDTDFCWLWFAGRIGLYKYHTVAGWEEVNTDVDSYLTSPNGTKYKLVVADDGTLSTEAVTT